MSYHSTPFVAGTITWTSGVVMEETSKKERERAMMVRTPSRERVVYIGSVERRRIFGARPTVALASWKLEGRDKFSCQHR